MELKISSKFLASNPAVSREIERKSLSMSKDAWKTLNRSWEPRRAMARELNADGDAFVTDDEAKAYLSKNRTEAERIFGEAVLTTINEEAARSSLTTGQKVGIGLAVVGAAFGGPLVGGAALASSSLLAGGAVLLSKGGKDPVSAD